jgi:hypothetical protein
MRWKPLVEQKLLKLDISTLNPNLVLAIIYQESSGNQWALKPEHSYPYLWDVKRKRPFRAMSNAEATNAKPPADFPCYAGTRDQEWMLQRTSLGLLQLMGACARERGFTGHYLSELFDPLINLEFGILHLWVYAYQNGKRSGRESLLKWNGGSAPEYPDLVLKKLAEIERQ